MNLLNLKASNEENISIVEPDVITNGKENWFLNKKAFSDVFESVGINKKTLEKLYNVDRVIWQELISKKQKEIQEFDSILENSVIVRMNSNVLAVVNPEAYDQEVIQRSCDKLFNICDNPDIEFYYSYRDTDNVFTIRLIGSVCNNGKYPTLVVTFDFNKSWYTVYQGYSIADEGEDNITTIVYSSPSVGTWDFIEFLETTDLETEMNVARNIVNLDREDYKYDKELSLREFIDIIKSLKIKFEYNEEGFITKVLDCDEHNSRFIANYLNSFSIPYKPLARMNYFRKYFKYGNSKVMDVVRFISREFQNRYLNITGDMLSNICNIMFREESDKELVQQVIKEDLKINN